MSERLLPPDDTPQDRHSGVLVLLLVAALVGEAAAIAGGRLLGNRPLLDVAVTLVLIAGTIAGVLAPTFLRGPIESDLAPDEGEGEAAASEASGAVSTEPIAVAVIESDSGDAPSPETVEAAHAEAVEKLFKPLDEGVKQRFVNVGRWVLDRTRYGSATDFVRDAVAVIGIASTLIIVTQSYAVPAITGLATGIAVALCLLAVGAAMLAARYLGEVDRAAIPEAGDLTKVARVAAWVLVAATVGVALEWLGQPPLVRAIHLLITAVNLLWCAGLLRARSRTNAGAAYPINVGVISALGARANIGAALLDAGERQLGIDLRSTWALTVVRRSIEPLAIGLLFVAWLSTAFTVVGVQEQGLRERFGVASHGPPMGPGLHLHWPWPVDRVVRLPTLRAQSIEVGHEGEEAAGPENVLWAVEHAKNEFTLVLGNGRDLIVIDAALHYRIVDPTAWNYHTQNPEQALKALAYRAVMRNTVNRTLSEALSENMVQLADSMRRMVQEEADTLGLGVEVLGYTIGGMHPPVAVAAAYQNVVSAEIRKATAIVSAQEYRNRSIPMAEAASLLATNHARAAAADALGKAAGEAWSFRALEAQYHAAPQDYMFRRRLESLEDALAGRGFIIVDTRFLRDGGQLWINP